VRVIDRQNQTPDEHFTEGELDLEPPEELAVLELDEETELEENLDSRADLEDEVDEDILESSLEHLVHAGDDEGDDDEVVVVDLEIEDLEDRAESLDRILQEKMAGDAESAPDDDVDERAGTPAAGARGTAAVDDDDEFVCRSCLLVHRGRRRAGASGSLCQDCSE
jgi:hypothetical protein